MLAVESSNVMMEQVQQLHTCWPDLNSAVMTPAYPGLLLHACNLSRSVQVQEIFLVLLSPPCVFQLCLLC